VASGGAIFESELFISRTGFIKATFVGHSPGAHATVIACPYFSFVFLNSHYSSSKPSPWTPGFIILLGSRAFLIAFMNEIYSGLNRFVRNWLSLPIR